MEHKWGDWGFNFEPQNEQNNDENREEQNVEAEEVVQTSIFEENLEQDSSNHYENSEPFHEEDNTFVPEQHEEEVHEQHQEDVHEEVKEDVQSEPTSSYEEVTEDDSSNYDDFRIRNGPISKD